MVGERTVVATTIRRAVERVTCHLAAVVGKNLATAVVRRVQAMARMVTATAHMVTTKHRED
jgi:hypothetical protein